MTAGQVMAKIKSAQKALTDLVGSVAGTQYEAAVGAVASLHDQVKAEIDAEKKSFKFKGK